MRARSCWAGRRGILPSMYESHALAKELKDERKKEERLSRITELEDRIFERASGVVEAALSFHEVSYDQALPPPSWVSEFGMEGAMQRLQVAKAGWMPQNLAPSAARLAAQVMTGISRGRAFRVRLSQNVLNVKINLPAPTSSAHPGPEVYQVKDIE